MPVSSAKRKPRGRYRKLTVSASQSKAAVALLMRVIAREPKKRQTVCAILQCSPRTGSRLLNQANPYNARMRRDWVQRICAAAGCPLEKVIAPEKKLHGKALLGWAGLDYGPESLQAAMDLMLTVIGRANYGFNLGCDAAVDQKDGRPTKVTFLFYNKLDLQTAASPGVSRRSYRMIAFEDADIKGKMMRFRLSLNGVRVDTEGELHAASLDAALRSIYNNTKKFNV